MYGRTVGQRDYGAEDAEERAILAKRNKALQLNPEWYESSDQMMEDIQGRKTADAAATKAAIQERAQQRGGFSRQGGFATGNPMFNPMAVAQHAGMMGAQQGNALQNMISQTTDAWRDEHDSRVSQNREMRRMEHEKEIERMRIEAMLQRLQAEQQQQQQQFSGPRPRVSGDGFAIY
jgi:hypothetical protein